MWTLINGKKILNKYRSLYETMVRSEYAVDRCGHDRRPVTGVVFELSDGSAHHFSDAAGRSAVFHVRRRPLRWRRRHSRIRDVLGRSQYFAPTTVGLSPPSRTVRPIRTGWRPSAHRRSRSRSTKREPRAPHGQRGRRTLTPPPKSASRDPRARQVVAKRRDKRLWRTVPTSL